MTTTESLTIRRADLDDALALLELAELDSAKPLAGEVLLAEVDGKPWAAIELSTGRAVADPFHPSAGVVEMLRLRAARLGTPARPARRSSLLGRHSLRGFGWSSLRSAR